MPEPIEGRNPFLGMPISEIAGNIDLVNQQMTQTKSEMLLGALQQNKGWLMEALHVEIVWNRTNHDS